jgi:acyl-CoA reductase-like NAD-dependent aldehyde dehydrogenase
VQHKDSFFIGGAWVPAAGRAPIPVIDPSTEEQIASVPAGQPEDVDAAVAAARSAFGDWAPLPADERGRLLGAAADALEARTDEVAQLISSEMGTPLAFSKAVQVGNPVRVLRSYAELAANYPFEEQIANSLVVKEPIGVVGAITPWNYPLHQVVAKVAAALAAGCTVVLKPAPETVLDAFLMAEAAVEAGLPAGVLNVVPAGREVGAYLVEHPGVDKVSFTGSTAAGRSIAQTCGRLLRPVTLELGGKSAAVVLEDADLTSTIEQFFGATLLNNGQICWLGTRVLAPRKRYDDVLGTITGLVESLSVGDPLDPDTQVGPLVSRRQRDRVESYIEKGKSEGGRLVVGGVRPGGLEKGWFVQPTVFADVDRKATIAQEEIFGPVLSVIAYDDEDDAVAIANDTDYGLGGSVWTSDPDRGAAFARRVRSGTIGINGYVNDPFAPFGGIKASGMGRELGPEGLTSFQVLKTIYLDEENDPA